MAIDFDRVPDYIRLEIDPPSGTIERGAEGGRVKRIQEWLTYHDCRTSIDSNYGPATTACVRDFQTKIGLPSTGAVDGATWEALIQPMRMALQAPDNINRMSVSEAVRAVVLQHVEQHPIEVGKANGGPWVRLYCSGHDGLQWAWCAGFVSLIMHQAYFYQNKQAPIEGSVSCDALSAQGREAGLFVAASDVTSGRVPWESLGGCAIFLRRRTSTDWTHAGFALSATGVGDALVFDTIEGNTNDEGSREGYEACRRKRSIVGGNYDFVKFA